MSDQPQGLGVYVAINAVMRDISREGISKDRNNQQQGYKFRGIDDVYNALCSIIAEHGLIVLPTYSDREVTERATKTGGVLFYTTVKARFKFVAMSDGSVDYAETYGEAMDSADKSTNKSMSAAHKYALIQAFQIPTTGDNDADAATHEVAPRQQSSQANSTSAAQKATQTRGETANMTLGHVLRFLEKLDGPLANEWAQWMHDEFGGNSKPSTMTSAQVAALWTAIKDANPALAAK